MQILVNVVSRAVFVEKFSRGFKTYFRHSRNIVGTVAQKCEKIEHLIRQNAVFFLNALGVDDLILHAVIHFDVSADKLHQIFVGRDDDDLFFRIIRDDGSNNVVSLETV